MRTRNVSSSATHDNARSACQTYIRSHASGCASSTSLLVRSVKEAAFFGKGYKSSPRCNSAISLRELNVLRKEKRDGSISGLCTLFTWRIIYGFSF